MLPLPRADRRSFLAAALATGAAARLPSLAHAEPRIVMNDASRLDPTPVAKHVRLSSSPRDGLVAKVRTELKAAEASGRRVAVGAARHSMGGQSLPRDGVAITFDDPWFEIDSAGKTYRVSAGARWWDVIAKLDPLGFSPKVMQSNADFGVASTFCINAHGWPVPFGPFGSTVRALRMVLADGDTGRMLTRQERRTVRARDGGLWLFRRDRRPRRRDDRRMSCSSGRSR